MYPILFDFGFWKIGSYGFLFLTSIGITLFLLGYFAARERIDYGKLVDFYFVIVISGLIGAKILHLVISYDMILKNPRIALAILISGGVWYGGLLTGVTAGIFYSKYIKISVLRLLDFFAPLIMLGLGISRFGCFLSGCCYGRPTNMPWAVTFTNAIAHRMQPDLPYVPLHPTQLYEAFGCFVLAVILFLLYLHKKFEGQVIFMLFILYGLFRSYIEIYRGDFRGSIFNGLLSTSQFIGLATALIFAIVYIYSWRKRRSQG